MPGSEIVIRPRTKLVMMADGPKIPWPGGHVRPFLRANNYRCWEGPRVYGHQRCGGGHRIIRKHENES